MRDEGKRQEILDAAGRVFAQYGLKKTTIGDIVREAGVARATLYKHFASKEDLFKGVLDREIAEVLEAIRAAVSDERSARGGLRTALVTHADFMRRRLNVYQLSLKSLVELLPRWQDRVQVLASEMLVIYRGILDRGVAVGEIVVDDTEAAAKVLLLAFRGLLIGSLRGDVDLERGETLDLLLDMLFDGLRPREEGRR
jgi:AcrR family transcriptional regulator